MDEKVEEKKEEEKKEEEKKPEQQIDRVDLSGFDFALNPDVFSGQQPQTDEEKAEMAKDEQNVRDACTWLRERVIPNLVSIPSASSFNAIPLTVYIRFMNLKKAM